MSGAGLDQEARCEARRRYVGVDEAASYLNVSRRWMYWEFLRHGLPRYYFGGKLRFRVDDLDNWARQQKTS
ncbi:helix-turn-helix domain-containing protein [Streptomyces sp. WG7]|uniref:helix-turn-helix domain-containing protein n=1 Tax=Streptomyces sp. WG7 TaxID=3417650 RepID=UPI003CF34443